MHDESSGLEDDGGRPGRRGGGRTYDQREDGRRTISAGEGADRRPGHDRAERSDEDPEALSAQGAPTGDAWPSNPWAIVGSSRCAAAISACAPAVSPIA